VYEGTQFYMAVLVLCILACDEKMNAHRGGRICEKRSTMKHRKWCCCLLWSC